MARHGAIHLGILGGGNISETHARAAQEIVGVEIAAFCGSNQQKCAELARRYGGRVYDDVPSFLEHRPMDLVAIGSPSGLHAEHGIAAARRGLHVLVEKPIDITVARADALISECERAGIKLGVFFQDRAAPDLCRLKELIDGGCLGKPILVSARVKWHRPPEYYSESRWRGTYALDGGGALINQGVHTIDLFLWLMGDVTRVQARAITALHRIEADDTVVATLEFNNGAVGTLEAATSVYPGYARRLELTGSEGTIIVEHDRVVAADLRRPLDDLSGRVTVARRPEKTLLGSAGTDAGGPPAGMRALPGMPAPQSGGATSPVVSDVGGHRRLLEDFIWAIEENRSPRCDGYEGRRSLALVEAIYRSSRTGQAVLV